ncbi:MAG: TonB-dependent receptor [Bacteroidales bacterium]|nr:TonB-dependent receptor [Bacteroidales bacterium]MCF8404883.1 TonB-dependent receptor [Bacteroidales bacterium]
MVKKLFTKMCVVLSVLLLSNLAIYAQSGEVSGTVTDASSGQTLPGVTIMIKGTMMGTTTDIDGKYVLKVDPGAVLVFSYIGFETQEVTVQPGSTTNIVLEVAAAELEEYVVIGYGIQKKSDATGSVTAVSAKQFNTGAMNSPTDLISGKIAGVQITSNSGAPGDGATIRIRGGSSLRASNDPLIVVDNVPLDDEGVSGMRNPLNTINPNDIETFTVLKDASATAIYGSRASNGVILITTKKGAKGAAGDKPFTISYNGTFSLNALTKRVEMLDGDEYRALVNERHEGSESVLGLLGDQNTNWQDEIYKNSFGMDHHVGVAGAVGFLPYRVSAGFSDQDGILKNDNMKRTTIGASLNPKFLDDHLQVNVNVKSVFVDNTFADRGAIGGALQFDPTKPVLDSESPYGGYWTWTQDNGVPKGIAPANPVALLNMRDDISKVNRLIGNVQLDYKLHFLPELRANLNLGYDKSNSDGSVNVPIEAAWEYDELNGGGYRSEYEQEKNNELMEFYLNYTKSLDNINSKFDVMVGHSWQHFKRTDYSISGNQEWTWDMDTTDNRTEYYLLSFFGRFNYTFKDRYLLTFTLRNDGTSRFSPDTRWGLFPSLAFGWKILDEPWMNKDGLFSQLKLRLGYGITGQQKISDNDYPYLPRYTFSNNAAQYQLGNIFYTTLRPEGYDANIKWEETTTYNLGFDYGFENDRYYGTLDFYLRETKDLINFIPVPAGSNLTNYLLTNVGDLENRGVEFSIYTKPIVKDDFIWEVGFNATYNKNEITKLTAIDDPNYLGVYTGGISGGVGNNVQIHSVGYPASSFFMYEQVYDTDGNPIEGLYVDRNGDGQISEEDKYHYKDPAADYWFGISSNIDYKKWNFSFSGRANFGNYVYDNVSSENSYYERLYRAEGPYLGNVRSNIREINFNSPQYWSNYFINDGSFFRMDNIRLSYRFDKIINGKANLLISATVNNAFVITKYGGLDPEINGGIDNNIYPRPRVYVLGINFQF